MYIYDYSDMIREYAHEALMWDKMADRELQGLVQPSLTDTPMELDNSEQISLRDRITSCNKVYQTAVKKIKTEEMWSLYIKRLLDINKDLQSLPNFKRKLLRSALAQAHQAKKLKEEYYTDWVRNLISYKRHLLITCVTCKACEKWPVYLTDQNAKRRNRRRERAEEIESSFVRSNRRGAK